MYFRLMHSVAAITTTLAIIALVPMGHAPDASAGKDDRCQGLSALKSLSALRGSAALGVERKNGRLTVSDAHNAQPLFVASCGRIDKHGLAVDVERPDRSTPARTFVRRDARGSSVYTHSVTARGARATVISAGYLLKPEVHLTTFDNDDFHIADGSGALIHSVTTKSDGTLVERQGSSYGCGCERTTRPDGRTDTRPLP